MIILTRGLQPRKYFFTIGSVEAFERQLEQAQRDMNLNPRDYVPVSVLSLIVGRHRALTHLLTHLLLQVQYVTDGPSQRDLFQLLPSLLALGFLFWASRSLTSEFVFVAKGRSDAGLMPAFRRSGRARWRRQGWRQEHLLDRQVAGADDQARREGLRLAWLAFDHMWLSSL